MNPQWSHDVYVTEKRNKTKTLLLVVVIAAVGYGIILLMGPILK